MNYCSLNDEDSRRHIASLLRWLVAEVGSAGGDGDALWYSKYYDIKDIYTVVKEINDSWKYKWEIKLSDTDIWWGEGQEGVLITNNVEHYKNSPSWQQVLIKY